MRTIARLAETGTGNGPRGANLPSRDITSPSSIHAFFLYIHTDEVYIHTDEAPFLKTTLITCSINDLMHFTMPSSPLGHPLILFIVGNLVTTSTAASTQKDSLLRYPAWLLSVTISFLALSNFQIYIQTTGWPGRMLAGALFTAPLVLFDRLLFRKWAFGRDFLGPVELPDAEKKKQSRWEFGSDVSGSIRCIGSGKEVGNVPYFSSRNPQYTPPRSTFLLRHACLVVGLYYLNTFCVDVQLRANQPVLVDDYVPFLSRINKVTMEEIITRVLISVSYWLAQYCLLQLPYSLFAVINVSLKPQELKFWRPMFGSIEACYTIRGFWG